MCLAIYTEDATSVPKDHLREGFESNPHGAGFAVATREGLVICKGYFNFRKFWKALRKYPGCPAIIHFRWATHGEIGQKNCHPWQVGTDLAVVHNGILSCKSTPELSDTGHFVRDYCQPLHASGDLLKPETLSELEKIIGRGNKMVFMDQYGDPAFLNENEGVWDKGVWYSNEGYRPWDTRWAYASPRWGSCAGRVHSGDEAPVLLECDSCLSMFNMDDLRPFKNTTFMVCEECLWGLVGEESDSRQLTDSSQSLWDA